MGFCASQTCGQRLYVVRACTRLPLFRLRCITPYRYGLVLCLLVNYPPPKVLFTYIAIWMLSLSVLSTHCYVFWQKKSNFNHKSFSVNLRLEKWITAYLKSIWSSDDRDFKWFQTTSLQKWSVHTFCIYSYQTLNNVVDRLPTVVKQNNLAFVSVNWLRTNCPPF